MKRMKLTKMEKAIEKALLTGEYEPVSELEFNTIADAIARKRKDAILNIRVNSDDLKRIKEKAKKVGLPYQSLISELLHRFAA